MTGPKNLNILVVGKDATKLADPLGELLAMSAEEAEVTVQSCGSFSEASGMLAGINMVLLELDLTKEQMVHKDKDFLRWMEEDSESYKLLVHLERDYPEIRVVALVDYPACESPESGGIEVLDRRIDGCMVKPFATTRLLEEIHRIREEME